MNSQEHANRWLRWITQQPLPLSDLFAAHVAAGHIGALCDCGCHGFTSSIAAGTQLQPLTQGAGLFCELAVESNLTDAIHVLLHTDQRGYFVAADVTVGACNSEPMPDHAIATSIPTIWPGGNLAPRPA